MSCEGMNLIRNRLQKDKCAGSRAGHFGSRVAHSTRDQKVARSSHVLVNIYAIHFGNENNIVI